VCYTDFQSKLIRKFLQSFLKYMPIGGITAATITEQQQTAGSGIVPAAMLVPPMRNTVATEFAGIVAGIEVHISLVSRQVIDAVRYQFALTRTGEIMIQCFHRRLRMGVAFSTEITDQLLLFGVYADHWLSLSHIGSFKSGDVLKLRIPIRVCSQRFFLACFTLP